MSDFERLLHVLQGEISEFMRLYDFLEKEVDLVTTLNVGDLAINTSKKEHILKRISKLSEKRDFYLGQVLKNMKNFSANSPTLKEIIEIAPDSLKESFLQLYKRYRELALLIKEKNSYNKEYLNLSISRVSRITRLINSHMDEASTYDQKGRCPKKEASSVLSKEL